MRTTIVSYKLYELNDWGKVPEVYKFYVLACSLFSAGVYGAGREQLTKLLYAICYVLCCQL